MCPFYSTYFCVCPIYFTFFVCVHFILLLCLSILFYLFLCVCVCQFILLFCVCPCMYFLWFKDNSKTKNFWQLLWILSSSVKVEVHFCTNDHIHHPVFYTHTQLKSQYILNAPFIYIYIYIYIGVELNFCINDLWKYWWNDMLEIQFIWTGLIMKKKSLLADKIPGFGGILDKFILS